MSDADASFQESQVARMFDHLSDLSVWEVDFINSIADRDWSRPLSSRQKEVLNKIIKKVDFGG